MHLFASVKLYNVYGYEKQIESIKLLSDLTEKEREITREIFLIRSEEAQKRGMQDEAHEYQRLATRVILGQSLVEPAPEARVEQTQAKQEEVKPPPRKPEQQVQVMQRVTPRGGDMPRAHVRGNPHSRKSTSRLFVSFVLVFGLAGVLVVGMLGYYAKKRGVEITDLFATKSPTEQKPDGQTVTPGPAIVAQVISAEELGFKVWGTGAMDVNRRESLISERIESQLGTLRQLYQQAVERKPELMGSLTLQLTIIPSGRVTKVEELASRIKDKEFKKLVIDEAYKWRFPEASSGLTKVNYPFFFAPPGMDLATLVKWEKVVAPEEKEPTEPREPFKVPRKGPPAEPVPGVPPSPKPEPGPRGPRQPQELVREKRVIGQYEVLYPTSVYSEPREDSRRVARVEAGTKVNVVDVQADWLEVRSKHGNPPGFIKKDSAMPLGSR